MILRELAVPDVTAVAAEKYSHVGKLRRFIGGPKLLAELEAESGNRLMSLRERMYHADAAEEDFLHSSLGFLKDFSRIAGEISNTTDLELIRDFVMDTRESLLQMGDVNTKIDHNSQTPLNDRINILEDLASKRRHAAAIGEMALVIQRQIQLTHGDKSLANILLDLESIALFGNLPADPIRAAQEISSNYVRILQISQSEATSIKDDQAKIVENEQRIKRSLWQEIGYALTPLSGILLKLMATDMEPTALFIGGPLLVTALSAFVGYSGIKMNSSNIESVTLRTKKYKALLAKRINLEHHNPQSLSGQLSDILDYIKLRHSPLIENKKIN